MINIITRIKLLILRNKIINYTPNFAYKLAILVGIAMILAFNPNKGLGQTATTANTTGNWSTTSWSNSVPVTGGVVTIPNGVNVTVDVNTANLNSITIAAGGTLTLNSNTKTLTVTHAGTQLITVNGLLILSGCVTSSQLSCTNLTIASTGTLTNNSAAASNPVLSVATTFINNGLLTHNAVGSGSNGSKKDLFGNASTITCASTSTVNITNWSVSGQVPPSLPAATYGNLFFNVSTAWSGNLEQNSTITSILGTFSVNATGGQNIILDSASTTSYNLSIGGDLDISGGTLSLINANKSGSGTVTTTVSGNLNVSGIGILNLNSGTKAGNTTLSITGNINGSGTGLIEQTKTATGVINLSGNLTLAGTSSLTVGANANLNLTGSAAQTITGNGNTISINNFNDTLNTLGTITLASNTPITVNNNIYTKNTGTSNQFSDGGNTIICLNNINIGGNAAGYNLTGTLLLTGTSGTQKIQYANSGPNTGLAIPATLNNVTISTAGAKVSFMSTATATVVTLNGNLISTVATPTVTLMSTAASSGTHTFNIGGNYTNNSTTTSLTENATMVFNGTSGQTITSSESGGEIFGNVKINNSTAAVSLASPITATTLAITSGTLNCSSNQITGNATGTFNMSAGTSLLLGSTSSATAVLFPTNFTSGNITLNNTSTVTYQSNGAQTVSSTPAAYGNLIVGTGGTSSTKTLAGATTVNGNLTINASTTLDASTSNFAINALGNWNNNGTFTARNGTVTFNGTTAQSIGGTSNTSFYNLTANNSSANVSLANAETVTNNLTITTGTLNCSSNQITGNATGSFNMSTGTSLLLGSTGSATAVLFPTNYTTAHTSLNAGSTVTYQVNGAQTVSNIPTYGNFIVSGSGTKTLAGTTTINGNATISAGTLDCSTFQITGAFGKNFTMSTNTNLLLGSTASTTVVNFPTNYSSGLISLDNTSTVTYQCNANQTISATPTYGNLVLSSGSSSTTKTPANGLTINGALTINANTTLDVTSANNYGILLGGNWVNNGTFNAEAGTVLLQGTSSQSLGGSSTTDFYNLTSNNSAGVTLSSAQNLSGSLLLNAGTFNTNSQVFTLLTNVNGSTYTTGNIGQITSGASISGNVTVQQYGARGGFTGWALLGTPITSALTFASWGDNFYITCDTCPEGTDGGFTSVYSYDCTQAGAFGAADKYVAITNITNAITPGEGYWVYLGTGATSTSAIMFDVTGTVAQPNSSPVNIPVVYQSVMDSYDDGWNLISNPLPSPIRWDLLLASASNASNIDNAIYVFNADLSSGAGAYAQYVNGVSSPAVGSGGIGDTIPMCQAFYVHLTGATSLTAAENQKVNANPTFLRINANPSVASFSKPVTRLFLDNGTSHDEAAFYFDPSASIHFETAFDAYKMLNDPTQPYITSMSDTFMCSINGLPSSGISVPVKAMVSATGTFTISLGGNPPADNCINLFDSYTGITTNLLTSSYVCTLSDTTTKARFTLSFDTSSVCSSNQTTAIKTNNIKTLSVNVYPNPNNGNFFIEPSNNEKQTVQLYDVDGKLVLSQTIYGKTNIDASSLNEGVYQLSIQNSDFRITKRLVIVR